MTTIKINNNITEPKEVFFDRMRGEFKMINENTGIIKNYAIIEFDYDIEDIDQVKTEQEYVSDICKRYTNEQLMQALALMDYEHVNDFDKLPKYVTKFEESLKSGEPMEFYDFIKNEDDLREYIESEWTAENEETKEKEINEHIKIFGNQYIYSPLGALFLNEMVVGYYNVD